MSQYRGKTEEKQSNRGKLGSFGRIIFEVSDNKIETISKYSREISASYKDHEVIGGKAVKEFLHANLQKVNFSLYLGGFNGINPMKELEKLEEICESGEVNHLLIGNTVIGSKWVITSVKETESIFDNEGNLLYVEVGVELSEYI